MGPGRARGEPVALRRRVVVNAGYHFFYAKRTAGEVVPLTVVRDGAERELTVELGKGL